MIRAAILTIHRRARPRHMGLRSLLGRLKPTPSLTHKMALPASTLASIARSIGRGDAGAAVVARAAAPRPAAADLVLFEYEASPYCRRVRETACALDLDVLVRPCPRTTMLSEGTIDPARHRFRAAARDALDAHAGRDAPLRFPLLVDSSAAATVVCSDSRAIVDHLCSVHGGGAPTRSLRGSRAGGRRASETSSTCSRTATCAACSPCRSRGRYPSAG